MALVRQHLIDPEICIRCNTCQEACPDDAITHNDLNYVIDFDVCQWTSSFSAQRSWRLTVVFNPPPPPTARDHWW